MSFKQAEFQIFNSNFLLSQQTTAALVLSWVLISGWFRAHVLLSPHPHLVPADGCPSLSLISSCSKWVSPSYSHQVPVIAGVFFLSLQGFYFIKKVWLCTASESFWLGVIISATINLKTQRKRKRERSGIITYLHICMQICAKCK